MKTYVIGDIHGRIEALREVLASSKFDYANDRLILLGDIVDGGYNTYEVVEELLKIKHIIFVIGNHDIWFMNHIQTGWAGQIWLTQGGLNTLKSYNPHFPLAKTHQEFFNKAQPYYIQDKMLFIHGGFDARHGKKVEDCNLQFLTWDRDLIEYAMEGNRIPGYEWIFVGHTTTQSYSYDLKPIRFNNLYMLDCGAGWTGKLCIMNILTKEYWLSKIQNPAGR
jgi:serine/threonine protein phosphatase 1